jgi:hypothetical protein
MCPKQQKKRSYAKECKDGFPHLPAPEWPIQVASLLIVSTVSRRQFSSDLSRAYGMVIAKGAYTAAAQMYPDDKIELRQGALGGPPMVVKIWWPPAA